MKITATGKRNGDAITVICDGDNNAFVFTFNGTENDSLQNILTAQANAGVIIGGTYYPETFALKLVAALTGWFFDEPPETLEVDGDIEQIPFEDDVIY